jgi:hypothetical protein
LSSEIPAPDRELYRIGFRAEYAKTGFAITRLIPIYDYSLPPLRLYPEAPRDLGDRPPSAISIISVREVPSRILDEPKSPIRPPENQDEESGYDEETWSKLPAWAKILADLKRKARQPPSK